MKILIVAGNSSIGAISKAISAFKNQPERTDIYLLLKDSFSIKFLSRVSSNNIITYSEGEIFSSFAVAEDFIRKLRGIKFDTFVIIQEKEKGYEIKLDILFLLIGAKNKLIFNAVKDSIMKILPFDSMLKILITRLIILLVLLVFGTIFFVSFILILPLYLLKGKTKLALNFFKKTCLQLTGYFFNDISAFFERIPLNGLSTIEYLIYVFKKEKPFNKDSIKKILVIRIEHIGDMVHLVPALRALRKNFPAAKITLLACPWNKEVIRNCPYIDETIIYYTNNPEFNRRNRRLANYFKKVFVLMKLLFSHYELSVDFGGWCETFQIAYVSKARYKVAMDYKRIKYLFNIKLVEVDTNKNEIERTFDLLGFLGISEYLDKGLELWISREEKESALVDTNDNLIGIYVGGSFLSMRWPLDNFVELVKRIYHYYNNIKIIVFNSPGESKLVNEFVSRLKVKPIVTSDRLSIREYMALIGHCKVFVTNDGGLSHIAVACNTLTVTLLGPSDYARWGNYSERNITISKRFPCSPCKRYHCIKNLCMEAISVEEVVEAVKCALA